MTEKATFSNLSKKEIDKARRTYRKSLMGRPRGFILWLLVALIWAGFGYLVHTQGNVSGTDNPTGVLNAFFGIPVVLLVVLFFVGNSRSIKKHRMWCAEVNKMDPALTEMFQTEWELEKAEDKRKALEQKEKEKEEIQADLRAMNKEAKELGKLIVKNIKEDIEDAWYGD